MKRTPSRSGFYHFASAASRLAGKPLAFTLAVAVILAWAATGPWFGFSDTWQLVVNTGTTIVTFLMVFLIQSTQNRDTYALQIKLDELIRAMSGAHDALLDLEELDDEQLERMRVAYRTLARRARADLALGLTDTDVRDIEQVSGNGACRPDDAPSRDQLPGAGRPT